MSRSGYSDDLDSWDLIRWRGAVKQALRGKRGQQFLHELITALEAMPVRELIAGELEDNGRVCALGAVGKQRGLNMVEVDAYDHEAIASMFNISHALACEVMFENDERHFEHRSSSQRWEYMYQWAKENLRL